MGYRAALEAAGIRILHETHAGDYDGMYLFHVEHGGVEGLLPVCYGDIIPMGPASDQYLAACLETYEGSDYQVAASAMLAYLGGLK